ncbi:hypothetical protein TUM4261_20730 [Shewanella sp. c952]|uniref:glycosyl transferase n=1 Tax=Shewanella sp. c952 TaxID=2815913 RepID=UPI001BB8652F|nr:glycosyl transferase [Shewanella sp. c952]GIU10561.1 hypothetical protein TUM4261_20730 [Shewanella sp. c952]
MDSHCSKTPFINITEPNEYKQLIRTLARGKKSARSLTFLESYQLIRGFYDNYASVTQLSVALMLMRVKGESAEEIAGAAMALRTTVDGGWQQLDVDIDWPCYGAKRDQLPYLLLSAKLLALQGYRILLHGDDSALPHRQHIAKFVNILGINSVSTAEEADAALKSAGICYVNADKLSRLVISFSDIHKELGLRSLFQSAIRCINPSNAALSLRSYFHSGLGDIHFNVARLMAESDSQLRQSKVAIFKGYQGECELSPRTSAVINIFQLSGQRQINLPTQLDGLIGSKANASELSPPWLSLLWLKLSFPSNNNGGHALDSPEAERAQAAVITNVMAILMLLDSSIQIDVAKKMATTFWQQRHQSVSIKRVTQLNTQGRSQPNADSIGSGGKACA